MRKSQITTLQSQVRRMRARCAQRCQQRSAELNDTLPEQWHTREAGPKGHGAMNRIAQSPKIV
jgi:hypothetical protein